MQSAGSPRRPRSAISASLHRPQRPGQKPRRLTPLDISAETPELHRRVLERHGRARVDLLLELNHLPIKPIDLLAGLGPGHGGGQAGAGPVELLQLEQAGFKVVFEGGERGGGHGHHL